MTRPPRQQVSGKEPQPPPLVEITLQSLKGFSIATTSQRRFPKTTAAVSFSGSASDMQISSSFVCPSTGNLMVESHAATTLCRPNDDDLLLQPLIARWNHQTHEGVDISQIEDLDQQTQQPHASIYLPPQDPRVPAMPVSRSNRDGKVVLEQPSSSSAAGIRSDGNDKMPSMDASDVSSDSGDHHHHLSNAFSANSMDDAGGCDLTTPAAAASSTARGGSIIWNASSAGAVMPEIIELNVSIKVDADEEKNLILSNRLRSMSSSSMSPDPSPRGSRRQDRQQPGGGRRRILRASSSILDGGVSSSTSDSWDNDENDDDDAVGHSDSIYEVGVAYLVLFGNDGGTTLMDVPVKRISSQLPNHLVVDPQLASLRLRVDVYPCGKKVQPSSTRASTGGLESSLFEEERVQLLDQQYHPQQVLEPILRQLKLAEDRLAARKAREHKRLEQLERQPSFLCGVMELLTNCDDGADGIGMQLQRTNSMDSSIVTSPSMKFW